MLDKIKSKLTLGTVTGALGFAAVLASVFKLNGLSVFLADPATALAIQTVLGGALGLIAGALEGLKKS
jgi:hypothetical protein